MEVPFWRKPFRDELLYGWLRELGNINFPNESLAQQLMVDLLFPYSKAPDKRGYVSKEPQRMDYIRGLDRSVREIIKAGYPIQDTEYLISFNTPLAVTGICRSVGDQARYIHTVVSEVTGGVMDMPTLPLSINKLYICPECSKEKSYLRVWHQLPGVKVCAIHGCNLTELYSETEHGQITETDIAYAKYVKQIYDDPIGLDSKDVKDFLSKNISGRRADKISNQFEDKINELMRFDYSSIKEFKELTTESVLPDNVRIQSRIGGIGTFLCLDCGCQWTDSIVAVRKLGCPSCIKNKSPDDVIAGILQTVGDGKYRLGEPFRGMGTTQEIIHDTCGNPRTVRLAPVIWNETTCSCEKAKSLVSVQKQINAVSTGFVVENYKPTKGTMIVRHKCGTRRRTLFTSFIGNPNCPVCEKRKKRIDMEQTLQKALGLDYEILDFPDKGKITLKHTRCGTAFQGNYNSIVNNSKRCPLCTVFFRSERQTDSYCSDLYIEMQSWFKKHPLWVARRHRKNEHDRRYYDALQVLVKKGFIYRVGLGSYANRQDLTVYEVLIGRYLIDDEGTQAGSFTNETESYLRGESDEPEVITLETRLLARKSDSVIWVQGRKVIVRGIPDDNTRDRKD